MTKPNLNLDILKRSNIEDIKKIWLDGLPNNLKNIIGEFTITSYLDKFFNNKNNLGLGLFKSNKIEGFVLYGSDNEIIKKILIENFFKIIISFLRNFFKFNFKNLIKYFDVLFFIFSSKRTENELKKRNCELLIIVFNKDSQNKGFGSFLLKNSFTNYKHFFLKFEGVFVKTLKETPENINFYKKNKFILLQEIYNRVYLKLNF